ncbi:protein of unknown function [endosymbiont DhMRE of Dentiscutata heterogama]|uniref:hypothetical protein n=1 Tax=endosymbiont DhMRE of Dentiscutata heterogama TaxID=1609546 RepID=UPI000629DAC7|nr:hypothetical protein [endosymbiont DhMRE of Dentiscutata heterogama]CFW93174.1 protein of unknown function [endosymbiont DhMRE of Dentiscutata heterogama]
MKKNLQEQIKEIEDTCHRLFQNYRESGREAKKAVEEGRAIGEGEIFKKIDEENREIKKELKNQILEEPSLWELDREGKFNITQGIPINLEDFINLIEYQREIVRAFVNEIKENPQDWKIETENWDHAVGSPEDYQIVKHKSGRKHYRGYQFFNHSRPGFTDEEWAEIENVINNQSRPSTPTKNPASNEKNNQQSSPQRTNNKDNKSVYYGIGTISLVFLVISMVVIWVKKR